MKYTFIILLVISTGIFFWIKFQPEVSPVPPIYTGNDLTEDRNEPTDLRNPPRLEIIAKNLTIPWEILFLPTGEILVTERSGALVLLKEGIKIPIDGVAHVGEGGLLGAALHPDFETNNFLYLFQTADGQNGLINRVDRYVLVGQKLTFDKTIIADLPGARYHDGGRIAFGPDGYLYVTLGDAGDEMAAQDLNNLAGSILRYTDEGEIPEDNPFDSAIYSYGHRNPQGLAWDDTGSLWSSEHGRSGARSGYDEINYIVAGSNYGWPDYEGDSTSGDTVAPARHSGPSTTWAPGGLAYQNAKLYMPGLRGRTLYEAVLDGDEIVELNEYLVGDYGRLRTVAVGPDGFLYLTTSNRDGRGSPADEDDLIIRINPELLAY